MKPLPKPPTLWHDFVCWFYGHPVSRRVDSDWLVYPKGDRGVAVFMGTLALCDRGHEIYCGPAIPWFEGTREDFDTLLKNHGVKNFLKQERMHVLE